MLVYRATNLRNGKIYIGRTVKRNVLARWRQHLSSAKDGTLHLHNAIRKYGPDAFKIEVLHLAQTLVELNAMETFFIVLHQSHREENGYNLTLGGEGVVANDVTRAKISGSKLGKKRAPFSQEWCANISEGMKRVVRSPEHCANIRRVHLGLRPSLKSREKMRNSRLAFLQKQGGVHASA